MLLDRALSESPVDQVLVEENAARLGRVRARADPRPQRQRGRRLLDREPRPDGRPHRRLGHGRAADDALRRGLPGAARRGRGGDPCGRRRVRRLEHPVRPRPRQRRRAGDRDEPARLALVRARLEGDGLSDREGGRQARGRLHARRDPERPHRDDAGELRADARLRRRQGAALRLREVPGRGHDPRHADEVGRRGDGDRPHVHRGAREGAALARARRRRGHALALARRATRGPAPVVPRGARAAAARLAEPERPGRRRLAAAEAARPLGRGGRRAPAGWTRSTARAARRAWGVRPGYRRVDSCAGEVEAASNYCYSTWGEADEAAAARRVGRDPRLRPEPDRPGDRVRLLLRPRGAELPRARLRGGDGQLQPGDRLDRLRHLRPPLLRAAGGRGGAGDLRARAAGRGRDPVRRPDAAEAGPRDRGRGVPGARDAVRGGRPRRGPQALRGALRRARDRGAAVGDSDDCGRGGRGRRARRLSGARAPELRARRALDAGLLRRRGRPRVRGGRRHAARRPLPGERDRDRRRRPLRREPDLRRRGHAARRGGGRPLGRLELRAARSVAHALGAPRGRARRAAPRPGARGGRAAERPARARRRRAVRAGGEPARLADGAVREQGDGRQPRPGRLPARGRAQRSPSSS